MVQIIRLDLMSGQVPFDHRKILAQCSAADRIGARGRALVMLSVVMREVGGAEAVVDRQQE